MNVLVFGASGATGSLVVEDALKKGHAVTVLVRDAAKLKISGGRVLTGDATNHSDVLTAMRGQYAVIDTIGGTRPYETTHLETTAAKNIIAAMHVEGARRLIVVSMLGLGESAEQSPFWYRYLLMHTFLRGSNPDKAAMEEAVRSSGLEYVIARPPILKDAPATGDIQILGPGAIGHAITRADLAAFLVDQLDSSAHVNQAVTVVNS
jgi:putative NADH-flavin reductase